MESTASGSSTRLCALCSTAARYTCPRCSTPTCSLPCSRTHKSRTGCSGERNKAAYVQMNAYGWGTMMRDYCFLEEVGRKVSEWGGEIAREGYPTNVKAKDMRGRGGARGASGRGRGGRGTSRGGGSSKRDLLKAHLDSLDIEMDVLSVGMQRRKVNQSTLDTKTQTALLTIEFRFYPGAPAQSSSATSVPYTTLVHRNPINSSLISLLQRRVPQHTCANKDHPKSKKEHPCPDWVTSLVHPHPDDPEGFRVPLCYLPAQIDLARIPHYPGVGVRTGPSYYKLCPSQTLQDLLQGTHFAEFPTIHVHDPDSSTFIGNIVAKKGQSSSMSEHEHEHDVRAIKRRKLSAKAGKKAISGLVGDYGSESESASEKAAERQTRDELGALGNYAESENSDQDLAVEARTTEDDMSSIGSSSADEGESPALDYAAVLELIKQTQGAADYDSEVVDWGDDWDEDVAE
ncbi:uncharacterized protein F5147DRAFT_564851 [Suillus discolor]|uniref:HIT-type domain-containing protein n=1 Tax=Suillus discolor TaxID=1912936 RepID=A0A9P7FJ17_9AGAM|nr:uncharacterized protein F5147DRAFT_564851 [Suillus discolor]KAG2118977.1 hypothetical protein F5147DRAFT_564851 [Suillus discolor]